MAKLETPARPSESKTARSRETTTAEAPGGDGMWIGEHAVDGDVLVFDPALPGSSENLSFYSMTQFRVRVFPRAVVARRIKAITDDGRAKKARKDYGRRDELKVAHGVELAEAKAAFSERQREQVIQRHERYLAAHGIAYQGVKATPVGRSPGRRVKCHSCGIALDDFAGSLCGVCSEVLCSCGACACASRSRGT